MYASSDPSGTDPQGRGTRPTRRSPLPSMATKVPKWTKPSISDERDAPFEDRPLLLMVADAHGAAQLLGPRRHVAQAVASAVDMLGHAVAVVDHPQQHVVAHLDLDVDTGGIGVAGHVRQGFAQCRQEM